MSSVPASPRNPRDSARRRWVLGLAIAVVAGFVAAYLLWFGPNWDRAEALELARKGEFERAAPLLMRSLDRRPADAEVLEALARGQLKTGDDAAAANSL